MKIKVKVTAEDIALGKKGRCFECPVALAMRRSGLLSPRVTMRFAVARVWGKERVFHLPPVARLFVLDFDYGSKRDPFEFEAYIA